MGTEGFGVLLHRRHAASYRPVLFEEKGNGMEFVTGFAVWTAIGLAGGFLARTFYRADVVTGLTLIFGVCGAFIGGMLGTAAYIHNNPVPLRLGSLIGATAGALFFSTLYHFIAKRAT